MSGASPSSARRGRPWIRSSRPGSTPSSSAIVSSPPAPDEPGPMSAGAAPPHPPASARDAQEQYWRERLAGPLPVLDIGSDRARPPVQTFHHATEAVELGPSSLEALTRLGASEHVSLLV